MRRHVKALLVSNKLSCAPQCCALQGLYSPACLQCELLATGHIQAARVGQPIANHLPRKHRMQQCWATCIACGGLRGWKPQSDNMFNEILRNKSIRFPSYVPRLEAGSHRIQSMSMSDQ